jgi:hypothetical protein
VRKRERVCEKERNREREKKRSVEHERKTITNDQQKQNFVQGDIQHKRILEKRIMRLLEKKSRTRRQSYKINLAL